MSPDIPKRCNLVQIDLDRFPSLVPKESNLLVFRVRYRASDIMETLAEVKADEDKYYHQLYPKTFPDTLFDNIVFLLDCMDIQDEYAAYEAEEESFFTLWNIIGMLWGLFREFYGLADDPSFH